MKVICVFPMFPVEKYYKNIPEITKKCKNEIFPKLCLLGAINPEIKFSNTSYTYVETNQTLEGEPKGKGILGCLKGVKDIDYVTVCDGSGKIPYEYIVSIFQELVSDSNIYCVMANRINNKAISPLRYLIERFEIYILKRYFNHHKNIPDGQCGLWGYQNKTNSKNCKKFIELTAEGYEIELDLLGEALEKELKYSFVDVELPIQEKVHTSFTFENNLVKMKFLINKYQKLKEYLSKYIIEFEQEVPENLKEDWIKYRNELFKLL